MTDQPRRAAPAQGDPDQESTAPSTEREAPAAERTDQPGTAEDPARSEYATAGGSDRAAATESDDGYAPGEVPSRSAGKRRPRRCGGVLREFLTIAVIALTLSFLVKTFLAQPFYIPSESMENTLDIGDRIVVSKFTPQHSPLHRGDIVVFEQPDTWGPTDTGSSSAWKTAVKDTLVWIGVLPGGGHHVVKRIIGLPGDKVACVNNKIQVNDVTLDETYVASGNRPCEQAFSITVPKNKVWVMGDNRDHSFDSRGHDDGTGGPGSVPESDITGQVVAIAWPLDRIGSIPNADKVFAKVDNP